MTVKLVNSSLEINFYVAVCKIHRYQEHGNCVLNDSYSDSLLGVGTEKKFMMSEKQNLNWFVLIYEVYIL